MIRKSTAMRTLSLVAACAVVLLAGVAQADMLSLWRLDESMGTVAPNTIAAGFDGTLVNGPAWRSDDERGLVLTFDGSNDYVDAVGIPAILATDNFTAAFWARSEEATSSNVILGNRYGGGSGSDTWMKFTPRMFEYVLNWTNRAIDYPDLPQDQWMHHAVVKDGGTTRYYRDGVLTGTGSVPGDMPPLPFYMGGDAAGERWRGRLDDVALFDEALSPTQIQAVRSGEFSAFGVAQPTEMTDTFDVPPLDAAKWAVLNKGLQSTVDGGYDPPTVAAGILTLGGTTSHSYWAGKTVASKDAFRVPDDGEVKFEVDRVSLTGSGTAYRSSMWMHADDTHFHHFSQNIGETNWQFNAGNNNPVGGGVQLTRANAITDGGQHTMALAHDGAFVKMFLDGRWIGSQAANFNQFHVMLTGQARMSGDTVSAEFDNARVTTRRLDHVYDNFNTGAIDPAKWTVVNKGLEHEGAFPGTLNASVENGELVIEGNTGSQYWYGVSLRSTPTFDADSPATFLVDRDALTHLSLIHI